MRVFLTQGTVLGIVLLLLAGSVCAEAPENYPFGSYDEALRASGTSGRPVFVYFGRYGCSWCERTNREAFSDPRVRATYTAHYNLAYVDAESGRRLRLPTGERITERELGARLNVYATPVFIYMSPQGEVLFKVPGIQTAEDFLAYDTYVREGHFRDKSFVEYQKASGDK